jgi:TonB family protein
MHVGEVLSSERTVPAVTTVAIHVLFAYVVATSAGIIPKPAFIDRSVFVDVPPAVVEPERNVRLISEDVPVTDVRFAHEMDPPIIPIEPERVASLVEDRGVQLTRGTGGGEGVSIPEVTGARILFKTEPAYPNISRLREEEGVVLLRITITAFGAIGSISVEKTSGFARLDEAAMKAVRQWRFAPAMRGSEAIATTTTVPVRFELR